MNESKRLKVMLGTVLVLILANLYQHMGEEGGSSVGFFNNFEDLSASYTPAVERKMATIQSLPSLNFSTNKEPFEDSEDLRNPFMFGVDKAKERANQERLERLAEARAEMEAQQEAAESIPEQEAAPPAPRFDGKVLGIMRNTETDTYLVSVYFDQTYLILSPGETINDQITFIDVTEERVRFHHNQSNQNIDIPLTTY